MNRLLNDSLTAALVFCICVSIVGPVRAAVIYSQVVPTPPLGAFSSNDTGQKIADNFLLNTTGSATVRSIRLIGAYGNTTPPPNTPPLNALPPDDFRVVFFADSTGAPGVPLAGGDFHLGAPMQRTPTGGPLLNGVATPLEYFVDLGTGITLNPATVYWVSILNSPGPNYGWAWARAGGVYDQQTAGTFGDTMTGPWSIVANGGMYFELRDTNVPEPNTIWILLSVACGVYRLRIGRRPGTRRTQRQL